MRFTKMHGAGNDYIYIDCMTKEINNPVDLAITLSKRHTGIGADGLILIMPSQSADFRMEMYNSDGSRGSMCGNGIRCVAKFIYDKKLSVKDALAIETDSGIKYVSLHKENDLVTSVTVDMGRPVLEAQQIPTTLEERTLDDLFGTLPKGVESALSASCSENGKKSMVNTQKAVKASLMILGKEYSVTCVSVGNPHAVVFLDDDVETIDMEKIGPCFERHPVFPERINTEFVNVLSRTSMKMRVWERGSGETMACGTGTCAVLIGGVLNGYCETEADILTRGGTMHNRWDAGNGRIFMTGPAVTVFEGEFNL